MKKIGVVFVSGDKWYSYIIKIVEYIFDEEKSKEFMPSHVGLYIDGHFREALSSGFIETDIDKLDKNKIKYYELEVDNEHDIYQGDKLFKKYWGIDYGWKALLNSFIYQITGLNILGDEDVTMHCSEVCTRILRAYGFEILPHIVADSITPQMLYKEIKKVGTLRCLD